MALKPHDPLAEQQGQEELKEALAGSIVPGVNLEAIKTLSGGAKTFEFPQGSGKLYDVPLVPYAKGLQLSELYISMVHHSKHDTFSGIPSIYKNMLDEILAICWSMIIPRGVMGRVLKLIGLKRNPMKKMSEAEIGNILGFFLARRMVSNVQFHSPATPGSLNPSQPIS